MKKVTEVQIKQILLQYPDTATQDIAKKYGISVGYVYQLALHHGIKKSKAFVSITISAVHRKISDSDLKIIEQLYPITLSKELAKRFGVSRHTIDGFSTKYGWKKNPAFRLEVARQGGLSIQSVGKQYQFPKGHIPANKGKKITEFMSEEKIQNSKAHRFKPGHIPKNHRPVGSERIDVDGYVWLKVEEPNKWRQKSHLTWEKNYGPIPKGMNCQFRDGIRHNTDISNLYLISKSQQLKEQNSMYARYPKEIQDNIRSLGHLTRQINKLKKQEHDQEQRTDPRGCEGGSI